MVAKIYSMGTLGLEAFPVEVETDVTKGAPAHEVVGLPDAAVKESRGRVRAAMKNCGFDFPGGRIVMNLAPADKRKEGSIYDLPLLLSLLKASGQLDFDPDGSVFLGELSLSGEVRRVAGVLAMAMKAKEAGFSRIFVPAANAWEAAVIDGLYVYPVETVQQLIEHLNGRGTPIIPAEPMPMDISPNSQLDFAEVRGQYGAKRALEIAASGGHSVLMVGTPGSGKSMMAKRLPSILPPMTFEEAIETTMIFSVAGQLKPDASLMGSRPFRSPHHSISAAGLSGGGSSPSPGEISLAHNGVLFLDELPEFNRRAIESLRQPMEDGKVTVSRVNGSATFPCRFMLVAAMNPCPCGYSGHPTKACTCSTQAVRRYRAKISGPLLERIDIHMEVAPVKYADLSGGRFGDPSAKIRERVCAARQLQAERFAGLGYTCNADIPSSQLDEACRADPGAKELMEAAFQHFGFSARTYTRLWRVSRTIADLAGSADVLSDHVAEAVQFRPLPSFM